MYFLLTINIKTLIEQFDCYIKVVFVTVWYQDIPEAPERVMTDTINEPILLCRFPAEIKSFYMQRCSEDKRLTESVRMLCVCVKERWCAAQLFEVILVRSNLSKLGSFLWASGGRVDAECRGDRRRLHAYLGLWGAAGRIQEGGNRPHALLLVHWPGKVEHRPTAFHFSTRNQPGCGFFAWRLTDLTVCVFQRKYGTCPHGGYGLGLERFLTWLLNRHHIRDVCLYPRFIQRCRPWTTLARSDVTAMQCVTQIFSRPLQNHSFSCLHRFWGALMALHVLITQFTCWVCSCWLSKHHIDRVSLKFWGKIKNPAQATNLNTVK